MPHKDILIKGKRYPSVTEVLALLDKPFLARWRGKIGNEEADRISRESAQVGRNVHQMIEVYLGGEDVKSCGFGEKEIKLFDSWWNWWTEQKYNVLAQEKLVISKKHKYGGTLDCILEDSK